MMLQAKQVDRSTGGEDWKSIQDLIKEHFLVRSYQRGYRWQRVNVFDLLNDLCDFIHSEKILYSLQPLVVYESTQGVYHVVDGQQRLTTVSILLGYLGLERLSIEYESRKGQRNTLVEESRNIDQYHVNQAYLSIEKWFEERLEEKELFIKLLTGGLNKTVGFVWYCTKDDELATFIRLNKNKITLTNSELIKALLLKKGNFDGDSMLIQKSIAVEWNKIENTFNDDAFWGFIRPIDDNRPARMDFLFDVIKRNNLLSYQPKEGMGNDQYTTFRYFYSYFKDNNERAFSKIWEKVDMLYNIFVHWYDEIEVYHYIGFLIVHDPDCLLELLDVWLEPNMTINGFKEDLKAKINKIIERSGCNNLSKQYKYNDEQNTDKTACRPVLLLFNIQRIIILNRNMNKKGKTQIFNKFPFYLFKSENWNVEHIASNIDNDLSDTKSQKEWLKTFLLDQSLSEERRKEITDFVTADEPDTKLFEEIRLSLEKDQLNSLGKEERMDDKMKNQIWNFCLLDEHTNKSYGNSIFSVKRHIVMGKEMGKEYVLDDHLKSIVVPNSIAFVPGCTKDVFIKAYTANDTPNREWSLTDAKAYREEMYGCLREEFNVLID